MTHVQIRTRFHQELLARQGKAKQCCAGKPVYLVPLCSQNKAMLCLLSLCTLYLQAVINKLLLCAMFLGGLHLSSMRLCCLQLPLQTGLSACVVLPQCLHARCLDCSHVKDSLKLLWHPLTCCWASDTSPELNILL